jgi:hypothetical protein
MTIFCSQRTVASCLAFSVMLAGLWPAVGLRASETAPSTEAGATEAWLVSRGLLARIIHSLHQ